jgi:hypothetical protein
MQLIKKNVKLILNSWMTSSEKFEEPCSLTGPQSIVVRFDGEHNLLRT